MHSFFLFSSNVPLFSLVELLGELPDGLHAGEVELADDEVAVARLGHDLLGRADALLHVAAAEDEAGAAPGQV